MWTETTTAPHPQLECCDNQLISPSPFPFFFSSLCKFSSCSAKPFRFFLSQKKQKLITGRWPDAQRRRRPAKSSQFLPYLVALVLVADGQQIQQNLVKVAQREVDTHHSHGITRGHLRAANRGRNGSSERGNLNFLNAELALALATTTETRL